VNSNFRRNLLNNSWFPLLILILISCFLYFFNLGKGSLYNTDEPIYAEVAREMVKLGDWLTLHFNYQEWFDKPPLYMWIIALFYQLLGYNELAVRLPSALFGLTGVLVLYFLGKSILGRRAAFLSAMILTTSLQYVIQSRLAVLDITLSLFISSSLLFFYLTIQGTRRQLYGRLFFLSMALATLTKGPIGLLLPLLIIGLYLVFTKQLSQLKEMRLWEGTLIYLAVASPWFIIQTALHGREFISSFFLLRHLNRYLTSFQGHGAPFYYFVIVLFLGFLPWSCFIPITFKHCISLIRKKWGSENSDKIAFLLIWFGVIFLFFSAGKSKLPGYILPAYPPLAILMGSFWSSLEDYSSQKKGIFWSLLVFLLIEITVLVLTITVLKEQFSLEYARYGFAVIVLILTLMGGSFLGLIFSLQDKKIPFIPVVMTATTLLLLVLLVQYVLPRVQLFQTSKPLAQKIASLIRPGEKIGNYPVQAEAPISFDCNLIFYADHPVIAIESDHKLIQFLTSKERVYCLMNKNAYLQVREKLGKIPYYVLEKREDNILLSNKPSSYGGGNQ